MQGLCPACLLAAALHATSEKNAGEQHAAGSLIGRYLLLTKIGEGGFGVVWKAEQREPIQRIVALKIIRSGIDTAEVIARFEVERQALALMNHPHIAQVFDAGTTTTDHPFFVMEFVDGIPITQFCDRHHLSTAERIRLFVKVCDAVQHAHQKGVIHRDLKPSNILVTAPDGVAANGVPKIIDFGIAKATAAPFTQNPFFTRLHDFVGTPAYASPEQVDHNGLDVDTRTDVYSLGVLLYMLLVGQPPFDPDALQQAGLQAMCRMIREVDPPRPSRRFATLTETDRAKVAALHSSAAVKLTEQLRGDLDWIVVRCLEKDRTRRFESASALARDLRHFLADEPVTARPPSTGYVLNKLVRRHRMGVTASLAVILALIAGTGLAVAGFRRAVAEQRATDAARAQAQQMITFIMDDLQPSLQAYGRIDALRHSAEMAVRYFDGLPRELRSEDTIRAHATALEVLFTALGGTEGNFLRRDIPAASTAILRALELRRWIAAAHPEDPDAAAAVLEDEGWLAGDQFPASDEDVQNQHAIQQYHELQRRFPDNRAIRRGLIRALRQRAMHAGQLFGKPADGLAAGAELCALLQPMLEQAPAEPTTQIEYALGLVAWSHATRFAGNLTAALRLGEQAAAVARRALESDPTNHRILANTALITQLLVYLHAEFGDDRLLEATQVARKYFQTLISLDPANSEWRITDAQLRLMEGYALMERHRVAEARSVFRETVASLESGPSGPTAATFLMDAITSVGFAAATAGDNAAAGAHLATIRERFLSVSLTSPGASLEQVLARFHWLYAQARLVDQMQAWTELEQVGQNMLQETIHGSRHFPAAEYEFVRRHATANACIGRALLRQGKAAEAIPFLDSAVTGYRDAPRGGSFTELAKSRVTEAAEDLAEAFVHTARMASARELLEAAYAHRGADMARCGSLPESMAALARTAFWLGQTFATNEVPSATRRAVLLAQAAELLEQVGAENSPVRSVRELHGQVAAARATLVP